MQIIIDRNRLYIVGKVKDLPGELRRLSRKHSLVSELIRLRQN